MTLGTRIKDFRTKSKLSQEKVAELVGVSRQAVTKWESDQSAPNMDNLFRLAEIFGTTVDALVTDETDERSVAKLVYEMIQEDKVRQRARLLKLGRQRIRDGLTVLVGYLIVFLVCKILWGQKEGLTLLGWLSNIFYEYHTPLFGWLLYTRKFWYGALVSIGAALLGLRRLSRTTMTGFVLGLLLGEYLGGIPGLVPEKLNIGYEIWTLIYYGSIAFGIWLQFFKPEELNLRSKKIWMFLGLYAVYVVAVVFLVLTSIPESYF